jgi:hypothetical protein
MRKTRKEGDDKAEGVCVYCLKRLLCFGSYQVAKRVVILAEMGF